MNPIIVLQIIGKVTVEGRGTVSLGSGRWYPHQHGSQVAATHGSSVRAWDMRTMKPTWCVEGAHTQLVRQVIRGHLFVEICLQVQLFCIFCHQISHPQ